MKGRGNAFSLAKGKGTFMHTRNSQVHAIGAFIATAVGVVFGFSAHAADDSPSIMEAPFLLSLGTFVLDSDTNIQFDGDTSVGTPIDWEDTFGGGDQSRFRVDGHWRFGDTGRHKMRFMWFNASRSNSTTIDEEIDYGGTVFPVDAKVSSDLNFDIYQLAYEYSFLRRETYELAGSIGLHYASLSASLSAKAETSNGNLDVDVSREGSVDAPLPVIGLRGLWALPHNFFVDAGAQFFALSIDEYDGNV